MTKRARAGTQNQQVAMLAVLLFRCQPYHPAAFCMPLADQLFSLLSLQSVKQNGARRCGAHLCAVRGGGPVAGPAGQEGALRPRGLPQAELCEGPRGQPAPPD
jgi:hypothetical protein